MELFLLIAIIGAGIWFFFIHKTPAQKEAIKAEATARSQPIIPTAADPAEAGDWKYQHEYKGTAIGINAAKRIVRLRSQFEGKTVQKDYPYTDIRRWEFNLASGGMTQTFGNVGVNAAIGVGLANYMQHKKNESQTGLFVSVRDVDCPEWHIMFPQDKGRELQLKRWLEILSQEFEAADPAVPESQ